MALTKQQQNTEARVGDLLREYAEITQKIEDDRHRAWEIEQELAMLPVGVYEGLGDDTVTVKENSRLNTKKAMSMLSPRSQARVMVTRPDPNLIRKLFPGVARKATSRYDNSVDIEAALPRHLEAVK